MGRVICVGGKKGGTGKSTLAVNLAGSYAASGAEVALLDCDDNQSAINFFTRRKKHFEMIENKDKNVLTNPIIKRYLSQVNHITEDDNNGYPAFKYIECAAKPAEDNLRQDISKLREKYDVIIIDTGGYKNNAFKSSLVSADVTYIPVMPSQLDLEQLPAIFELIGHMESSVAMASGDNDFKLDVRIILNGTVKNQQAEVNEAKQALEAFKHVISLSGIQIPHAKILRDLVKAAMFLDDINDTKRAIFQLLRDEIEGTRGLRMFKDGLAHPHNPPHAEVA